MAKKIFTYTGKTVEELQKLSMTEFAELVPSRVRRSIKRMGDDQKRFLEKVEKGNKNVKTHNRDMPITPSMIGKTIKIYQGKEFVPMIITEEMLGHCLGEFAQTRKKVQHSAPGIVSTKSSGAWSVK